MWIDPDIAIDAAVPLHVEHAVTEQEVHVWLYGELDIATHDDLQTALSGIDLDDAAAVTLHLPGLSFCDARGGRLLLRYLRQASDRGLLTSLADPTPAVRRVLDLLEPDTN
jgi:anti-anti-sigma factor